MSILIKKMRPVEAELFHEDGQTYRRDEASSKFSQFCESAKDARVSLLCEIVLKITVCVVIC
jgi:hypothetical protein